MNISDRYHPHSHIRRLPIGSLYDSREGRANFVAHHFREILLGAVLDVGCSDGTLRAILPLPTAYVGIDLSGAPDVYADLDGGYLPFADCSFDVVVCTDVLEHLERIHFIFDELIRVSRTHVIISLPNNWSGFWRKFLPGATLRSGKYYGLPSVKPNDRHRWFFNSAEAIDFLEQRAQENGASVVWRDTVRAQSLLKRTLLRIVWGSGHWIWSTTAVWAVIEKSSRST